MISNAQFCSHIASKAAFPKDASAIRPLHIMHAENQMSPKMTTRAVLLSITLALLVQKKPTTELFCGLSWAGRNVPEVYYGTLGPGYPVDRQLPREAAYCANSAMLLPSFTHCWMPNLSVSIFLTNLLHASFIHCYNFFLMH